MKENEKNTLPTFEEGVVESIRKSFLNTTWMKKSHLNEHIGSEIIPLTMPAYDLVEVSEKESELTIHWANLDVKMKLEWDNTQKCDPPRILLKKISIKA